ncbi:cysteine desulfurase family protein [Sphingomonas sp. CFBP 13720]|uniref:cysteine desulfurase family protein n=1 Tax=Sphingomonas sp. CFBP 13720 TaxID=2775302 RepID=UPI0017876989|nr:cysteine desulfurase family protein [Sphingomonas sp. CFBP 13720]MBD8676953.1 cysteine desulfurase [Sphingomonas sp. CFBP 13720]
MTYLDYQATTPLAPAAFEAMVPWLRDQHANPHSPHREGRRARAAVELARDRVLAALVPTPMGDAPATEGADAEIAARRPSGIDSGRLFITSGATEAANWAIAGTFDRLRAVRPKVVTIATEHACVLDTCRMLQARGAELVVLPVGGDGLVDMTAAEAAIDDRTAVVAAMLVSNEIGVIQPIARLGRLAHAAGAMMFCDAVQGWGRVGVPLWACDLVAVSAHKVYGPKGIGALWVRHGAEPAAILHGGGQEGGLRSGTLSPALCAGFGAAAMLLGPGDLDHAERLWAVARDILRGPDWILNGDRVRRYRGNLNVRMAGLDVARLMSECRDIAFSAGSACASGSGRTSHVLRAIGLSDVEAKTSIRIGFGRDTTEAELVTALEKIDRAARSQRT